MTRGERELGLKVAVDTAMTAWLKAASAMSGWERRWPPSWSRGFGWARDRAPLLREMGPTLPDLWGEGE